MVKCAIVTLQNIRRLSLICPPFCPFKSTYSPLAFSEVFFFLLVLFPHLCNFLGTCWNHVTSPWYFSILKSWNFCWWHINLDLMYINLYCLEGLRVGFVSFLFFTSYWGFTSSPAWFLPLYMTASKIRYGLFHLLKLPLSMDNKILLLYLCPSIHFSCGYIFYYLMFKKQLCLVSSCFLKKDYKCICSHLLFVVACKTSFCDGLYKETNPGESF